MYSHWGNWSAVSRGGAGYNAWTGRGYAYQYGHAYNSVTGTMAAGQRGAVQNVYSGNYAFGGRGAAYNQRIGMAAAGSRYTVGNAYSGRQARRSVLGRQRWIWRLPRRRLRGVSPMSQAQWQQLCHVLDATRARFNAFPTSAVKRRP
jgi:hypothetical protein